jgi:GNAT superfamily N-acetyltransferase
MVLLLNRDARRLRRLFESEHLALVLDAVVAGNSPARVWADDFMAPRTALVWDGAHSVYLAGAVDEAKVWRELFDREIAPLTRGLLKAYATHHTVEMVFAGYPFQRRERVLYRGVRPPIPDWRRRLPAGFHISAINDRFSELSRLANGADVIAEIESCWISAADFRRTGFGFVAHDAEAIVCWCTAESVSDGKCGIGIATVAAYRGRGFATLTASAFAERCTERQMTPYWDAWRSFDDVRP